MHGVSEVIAIILILMITIAIAGLAYAFVSSTMTSVTASASSTVDTTTSGMLSSFTIESMDLNKVYVRNTGQNVLENPNVYVNDNLVSFNMTPLSIANGGIGSIAINGHVKEGDVIKIVLPNGFSSIKSAPTQCYGAVACWRFDQDASSFSYDSVSMNTGTLTSMNNAGNSTSGWTSDCRFGTCLRFDGINDKVLHAGSVQNWNGSFSLSLWINIASSLDCDGNNNFRTIITNSGSACSSRGWDVVIEQDRTLKFDVGNGTSCSNRLGYYTPLPIGAWSHLAFVYDEIGGQQKFYLNGNLVANRTLVGVMMSSSSPLSIGGGTNAVICPNADGYVNATMDDVAIWNYALSDGEIARIFNQEPY